jgi:hypothetical protein
MNKIVLSNLQHLQADNKYGYFQTCFHVDLIVLSSFSN